MINFDITEFENNDTCIIDVEYDKSIEKFVVYYLNKNNHWVYLARYPERKNAVYFAYRFFACHKNFTRFSINHLIVN